MLRQIDLGGLDPMPSVPQYNRLGFLQGAQLGLDSSKASLDAKLRREQQAQQQRQFEQSLEEERRRNLSTEALSGEELGERRRQFDVGFGDTQARTGLLGREQAEQEKQGAFSRDLSGKEFGLKDFDVRNQALARQLELGESRRSNIAREGLTGQELTESQRRNLAAEQLSGKRLGLDERTQMEAERAAREQEFLAGRKLTVEEEDMLRREALSRASLAEQQRAAQADEALGLSAEARQQAQLEEAKRAALILEAFKERQQGQSEREFGQTFGLQERAQQEVERRNPILEALDKARADAEIQRSNVQNQVSLGGLDISRRAQTEAETEGQFGRQAKVRELDQRDAQLQFQRFEAGLKNAVDNRQLDITQAKYLRDDALARSSQGVDLIKFYTEQAALKPGRDASTAAALATAASTAPWQEEYDEAQRGRDATALNQRTSSYANSAAGMQYQSLLRDWEEQRKRNPNFEHTEAGLRLAYQLREANDRASDERVSATQDRRLAASAAKQKAELDFKVKQAEAKAATARDPRAADYIRGKTAIIKSNYNDIDGLNPQGQYAMLELDRYLESLGSSASTTSTTAPQDNSLRAQIQRAEVRFLAATNRGEADAAEAELQRLSGLL